MLLHGKLRFTFVIKFSLKIVIEMFRNKGQNWVSLTCWNECSLGEFLNFIIFDRGITLFSWFFVNFKMDFYFIFIS